jgi:ABC-2 type transport system permease protein
VPVHLPWQEMGASYAVPSFSVLVAVGALGYALALWTFCRRDLPAPL